MLAVSLRCFDSLRILLILIVCFSLFDALNFACSVALTEGFAALSSSMGQAEYVFDSSKFIYGTVTDRQTVGGPYNFSQIEL